ncbi:hypothetical protein Cgig2_032518 [Carnegiea gigantea]|uniref:BHLH domain-containing protein n=1 Tax=Carnegiea gigantea TaxID=171969 RepID=A0A9Q1KWM3_9CARY|nr:hypothetical protein Cgig2_032518 [Carnegiea gigantea]
MNRDSPEMIHCLNMAGTVAGVKGMEMSVLERQRMILKWQHEQLLQVQRLQQEQDQSYFNEVELLTYLTAHAQDFQGLNMNCVPSPVPAGPTIKELLNRPIKTDPGLETRWTDSGIPQSGITAENSGIESVEQVRSSGYEMNYAISRTASCPPLAAAAMKAATEAKGFEAAKSDQKPSGAAGRDGFKKRKAEKNLTAKVDAEEAETMKKRKGCGEEEESKITEQNSNSSQSNHKESQGNNNKKNKEASGCTSKDNSKASEVAKPDYIHVRARRGQATDSHSLAERVRREKISERMKYLQELVPGCNKITGKAGMLDEIINYVQSLQRQVEFLSMKLAAVNPRLDFNIDDLIAKEGFAACSTSLPTMRVLPDINSASYLQYNPVQQMDPVCGSEVALNPIDVELRRTISAPVSLPDTFIEPSCFDQMPSSLPWDADLQNIYSMEFQQGRPFPLQTFTGTIEASGLKMEM